MTLQPLSQSKFILPLRKALLSLVNISDAQKSGSIFKVQCFTVIVLTYDKEGRILLGLYMKMCVSEKKVLVTDLTDNGNEIFSQPSLAP